MVSFNRVVLAGNLTRDPELRFTQSGVPVCDFGIAVNQRRSDGEEQAHFFDVTAWRGLGETIANYKKKGDPILVEGKLQYRSWEAQDGSRRSKVDVVADNVQFLGGRDGGGEPGGGGQQFVPQGASQSSSDDFPAAPADDDIPF